MDHSVIRAMAKWPNVPAVYGWLSLDRRGAWRLKDEPVTHRGAVEFINRNYACTESGQWYFQNGPQRAYVDLEYTPWVYTLDGRGGLVTHVGESVQSLDGAWLDDLGNLLLLSEHGIGLVCDRDLHAVSEHLRLDDGSPCEEDALIGLPGDDGASGVHLLWGANRIALGGVLRDTVAERFGFDPRPRDAGN
jgi:hypothetical protein